MIMNKVWKTFYHFNHVQKWVSTFILKLKHKTNKSKYDVPSKNYTSRQIATNIKQNAIKQSTKYQLRSKIGQRPRLLVYKKKTKISSKSETKLKKFVYLYFEK